MSHTLSAELPVMRLPDCTPGSLSREKAGETERYVGAHTLPLAGESPAALCLCRTGRGESNDLRMPEEG
jgi:hypothetical protein